jgi:hypothetical protein
MLHPHKDPFKRFKAHAETPQRARELLDVFYRKFGSINGQGYLCAETAIDHKPGAGYVARLGFVPWPYPIAADDRVDFDALIVESGAIAC